MSERPSLVTTATSTSVVPQIPVETSAEVTAETPAKVTTKITIEADRKRRRYSAATAARVVAAFQDVKRIDDVVTISAIARRTKVSRPIVRAVLRQECGWTPAESRRAHHAGVRRGKLLQAIAGHPGLVQGRTTLQSQGWPNLQRAQQTLQASAYSALERGRETQATSGWPGLRAAREALSTEGYPHLEQGRRNLAARGWPNVQRAHDTLRAQDYLPLLEAQRLRMRVERAPLTNPQTDLQTDPQTELRADRRLARGRTTRLAILAALQADETKSHRPEQHVPDPDQAQTSTEETGRRVTMRELAARLHLHPSTVYAHVKQMQQLSAPSAFACVCLQPRSSSPP